MLFRSSQKRHYFQAIFWATAFDVALVFLVVTISGDDRDFWGKIFFGVIILWLVQIAIALKSGLFSFLYFWFFERDQRIEATLTAMTKWGVPKYEDDIFLSAEEYFEKVASDFNSPVKAIAFAGANLGAIGVLRKQSQFMSAFQWGVVMERALEQHIRNPGGERRGSPETTEEELSLSPNQKDAFERGKGFARDIIEAVDEFMDFRFGDLNEKYLAILGESFDEAISQQEHSPIIIARIDMQVQLENIEATEPKIRDELNVNIDNWRRLADEIGAEDAIDRVVDDRVASLIATMKTSSLELFLEKADQLKAADDKWRRENPEKAKLEPLNPDDGDLD